MTGVDNWANAVLVAVIVLATGLVGAGLVWGAWIAARWVLVAALEWWRPAEGFHAALREPQAAEQRWAYGAPESMLLEEERAARRRWEGGYDPERDGAWENGASVWEPWEPPSFPGEGEEEPGPGSEPADRATGPAPADVLEDLEAIGGDDADWARRLREDLEQLPEIEPGREPAPGEERLAQTGELELAILRSEHAAELDAQDADVAEFMAGRQAEWDRLKLGLL